MTKQIEDYPEKWLSALCKERTGMSLNKFKQEYYCDFTPEKMVIDTNEYREMQSKIDSLTEQNKELQDREKFAVLQARIEEGNKHAIADLSWTLQRINYLNSELDKLNKESK